MAGIFLIVIIVLYLLSQFGQSERLGGRKQWLPPEYDPRLVALNAGDTEWKNRLLTVCESPAEVAFLKAMIAAYGLTPQGAWLKGGGLSLTLQTKLPPYRVDFLANEWLVIEIDGAAYHTSPEAVAADKIRDAFLLASGYSTIRIPAKVVFNDAAEAVRRARMALAEGPPDAVRQIRAAAEEERTRRTNEHASARTSSVSRSLAGAKQLFQDVGRGIQDVGRGIDAMDDAVKAAHKRELEWRLSAAEREATARHQEFVWKAIVDLEQREYDAENPDPTGAREKRRAETEAHLRRLVARELAAMKAERGHRTAPNQGKPSAESWQDGEVERALAAPRHAVVMEQALITIALQRAELEVRLPELEKLKKTMESFALFRPFSERDEHDMRKLVWRDGRYERPCKGGQVLTVSIPALPPAPTHADAATSERIGRGYRDLLERRAKFLEDARRRVNCHPLLPELVKGELRRFGAGACWDAFARPPPEQDRARVRG